MKVKKVKNNRKKRFRIFDVFAIMLLIVTCVFAFAILKLDILVTKYLVIVFGILFIINLVNIFFIRKGKKKLKIFACVWSVIFSALMILASNYIFKTTGVLNSGNLGYKSYNFSVVVLKDSNYKKIKDLKDKTMAYYEIDDVDSELFLDEIMKKVEPEFKVESSYTDAIDKLAGGEVEAAVIEDSYLAMINESGYENGKIKNFSDDTKVIYTFSIKVKTEDISKDLDVTKKAFNIYISGMDEYGTVASVSRSDVNIVVTINPETRQILLTSIPRDYYVQVHGTTGLKDKLTHAGLYGVESSVSTIEDLLGIEINYYVKVNFSSVVNIINAIGGVDVYSEYDFVSEDNFHYSKGYNKVNGEEALSFARERHAFASGDNQRGKNQQALLEAAIRKCTSSSIIYKYNSLLKSIDGSFMTNMSTSRITSLIKMQLNDMSKGWTVTSNSLVGDNGSEYTYSYSKQKLYVMIPDEDSVSDATQMIKDVMNGEKLESSYDKEASDVHSVYKSDKSKKNYSSSSNKSNSNSSSSNSSNNSTNNNTITNDSKKDTTDDSKKDTTNNSDSSEKNNTIDNNKKDNNSTVTDDKKNDSKKDDSSTGSNTSNDKKDDTDKKTDTSDNENNKTDVGDNE